MNEGMKKIFTLIIYQVSRQLWGGQTMVLLWIKNAKVQIDEETLHPDLSTVYILGQ